MNIILRNIKSIATFFIIILLLFLAKVWLKDKIIIGLGGYLQKETVITIDSTFVTGKTDTLDIFNYYIKTKGIILNPKAEIVYIKKDTKKLTNKIESLKNQIILLSSKTDSLKKFKVNIKDSVIDGVFFVYNKFNGDLAKTSFIYKPLYPKLLRRVDTIFIDKKEINTLTKERNLIGIGAGYNNLQYFSLLGSYTNKNNLQFIIEYGKPLNNTINIINSTPFIFNNKDLYSFKIIKHF